MDTYETDNVNEGSLVKFNATDAKLSIWNNSRTSSPNVMKTGLGW